MNRYNKLLRPIKSSMQSRLFTETSRIFRKMVQPGDPLYAESLVDFANDGQVGCLSNFSIHLPHMSKFIGS